MELLKLEESNSRTIGLMAEFYIYHFLRTIGGDSFSQKNWISTACLEIYQNADWCTDMAGYDFVFTDKVGCLGKPGMRYLLEVKGHLTTSALAFLMTENEWNTALACNNKKGPTYVTVGVAIFPSPQISFWLNSPCRMEELGQLKRTANRWLVSEFTRSLPSISTSDTPAEPESSHSNPNAKHPDPKTAPAKSTSSQKSAPSKNSKSEVKVAPKKKTVYAVRKP
jgi:hypothetical protein